MLFKQGVPSDETLKQHTRLWNNIGSNPDLKWIKVYASVSQIEDPCYITETDYYNKVEPVLNNRTFSEAYSDKNFYHGYLNNTLLPKIYLRNIQGVYYTEAYETVLLLTDITEYLPSEIDKVIVKQAIDSGGGRDVELFKKADDAWKNTAGEILSLKYLEQRYEKNFVIQEYIQQHPFYSQFNKSSVNTIRLFTYRSVKTNEVIPLQSVLRIGRQGSIVDNQASGGIACGINIEGRLNGFGVNKKGTKFFSYNEISFRNVGELFRYKDIVDIGTKLAKKYFYHRLLGFDFCVDRNGKIILIEINNRNNEINFYQMNNGPLFREYTNEIIDYCSHQKKTICFDFEVKN